MLYIAEHVLDPEDAERWHDGERSEEVRAASYDSEALYTTLLRRTRGADSLNTSMSRLQLRSTVRPAGPSEMTGPLHDPRDKLNTDCCIYAAFLNTGTSISRSESINTARSKCRTVRTNLVTDIFSQGWPRRDDTMYHTEANTLEGRVRAGHVVPSPRARAVKVTRCACPIRHSCEPIEPDARKAVGLHMNWQDSWETALCLPYASVHFNFDHQAVRTIVHELAHSASTLARATWLVLTSRTKNLLSQTVTLKKIGAVARVRLIRT